MHVAEKIRKTTERCHLCHLVKPSTEFMALHKKRYSICKECKSHLNRLHRFKLSPIDYEALLDAQDNKCAICEAELVRDRNSTVIDHCHDTNEVRGVLCRSCNTGLGNFKDKNSLLANAAKYLIDPPARKIVKPLDIKNKYKYLGDLLKAKRCNTSSS